MVPFQNVPSRVCVANCALTVRICLVSGKYPSVPGAGAGTCPQPRLVNLGPRRALTAPRRVRRVGESVQERAEPVSESLTAETDLLGGRRVRQLGGGERSDSIDSPRTIVSRNGQWPMGCSWKGH